jgi:DNA primase
VIPDGVIDEIRGRVDIVAVIGRHVELKRSGRTWKGCCVFHGERTPSFHVYPEDRHFKCYGCGEYGDVFKFLQKLQGKEFPEVVRALAMEVGVEIPEREEDSAEHRQRREERRALLAACDAAARYFAARLASRFGEPARAYLAGRGFTDEIVQRFRLGVASTAWDDLTARLGEKGVAEASLEKAGLVARRPGGDRYDRFRARLIVPIAGLDGEVIGFGGRVLPGAPDKLAKYINSPESPLYKKSRVLYGIDQAREHIRRTRSAVLVEGYFDVIGLHQAGVKNAVAVCGTALTPEHVELLKRCDCREVTVLFDGDPAGQAAPGRAAAAILPAGIAGRVALLPAQGGKIDPDEYARAHGLAAVEKLLADAVPLTEFLLERALANAAAGARRAQGQPAEAVPERAGGTGGHHPPVSMESKLAAFRELKPFLALAPAGLARTMFEERVAQRLDVPVSVLAAEMEAGERHPPAAPPAGPPGPPARPAAGPTVAPRPAHPRGAPARLWADGADALGLLASFPDLVEVAREERLLDLFEGTPLEGAVRALLAGEVTGGAAVERLGQALPPAALGRIRKLVAEARPDADVAERELRKAVVAVKIERLAAEIDRLSAAIARAGSPIPDDLRREMLVCVQRRSDLEKRRDGKRPG